MKHVLICGDGCSFGNAGMIVPSHFTPLAAPGAIGLGLRWLLDPGSPLYIRPRFDPALAAWLVHFARGSEPRARGSSRACRRRFRGPVCVPARLTACRT